MKKTGNKFLQSLILLVAFSLSTFAQSVEKSKKGSNQMPKPTLGNTVWLVVEIKDFVLPELEYQPRITFFPKENRVTGTAGCNHLSGKYKTTNKKYNLAISKTLTTAKHCEQNESEVEHRLSKSFGIINRFEIKDGNLYLFQGKNLLLTLTAENRLKNSR